VRGVGGDVCGRHEDSPVEDEDCRHGEEEAYVAEAAPVECEPSSCVAWQTSFEEESAAEKAGCTEECETPDGPCEADACNELREHYGVQDAAEAAGCCGEACGETAVVREPVAEGCDTCCPEDRGEQAT
jgi:hypothetical protein